MSSKHDHLSLISNLFLCRFTLRARRSLRQHAWIFHVQLHAGIHRPSMWNERQWVRVPPLPEWRLLSRRSRDFQMRLHARYVCMWRWKMSYNAWQSQYSYLAVKFRPMPRNFLVRERMSHYIIGPNVKAWIEGVFKMWNCPQTSTSWRGSCCVFRRLFWQKRKKGIRVKLKRNSLNENISTWMIVPYSLVWEGLGGVLTSE